MKIIETGNTYKVYGEDLIVLDKLPAHTYKVFFGQFTGFYLEKQNDLEIKEDRVYGVHETKANKVLDRFGKARKNLGVILSGDKGIGKSLFARLLAQKAIQNGIPVILVDNFISGIGDFLNSIQTEALILFDEFDKTFAKKEDNDPQSMMLSLFDGTSCGKKLFVVTCNKYYDLNEYMINRPGRFHFHFRFDYPTADEVKEYLNDKLNQKYHSEINKVVAFSRKTKLNYDCLAAIALELNEGDAFEDAIKDLNIIDAYELRNDYNIAVYTEEGVVFTTQHEKFDMLGNNKNHCYITDSFDNGIYIDFFGNYAVFNPKTNSFVLDKSNFNIEYDKDYIDEDKKDQYKNLHYTYAEITTVYDKGIHYKLV